MLQPVEVALAGEEDEATGKEAEAGALSQVSASGISSIQGVDQERVGEIAILTVDGLRLVMSIALRDSTVEILTGAESVRSEVAILESATCGRKKVHLLDCLPGSLAFPLLHLRPLSMSVLQSLTWKAVNGRLLQLLRPTVPPWVLTMVLLRPQ